MIVSYEINILCESDNCDGHGGSGIFTATPSDAPNLPAALQAAVKQGWLIVTDPTGSSTKAFCPDCADREKENT